MTLNPLSWFKRSCQDKITKQDLLKAKEEIMASVKDLAALFQAMSTGLTAAQKRIEDKLQVLTDALGNAQLTPEAQTALDDLTKEIGTIEGIVPETPPAP